MTEMTIRLPNRAHLLIFNDEYHQFCLFVVEIKVEALHITERCEYVKRYMPSVNSLLKSMTKMPR